MRQLIISHSITNRESPSVEKYFQEINKFRILSPEEEVHLSVLIKNGDKAALETLVKANLRFVVSVAKQFQNQGLSLLDLINEGNIGLIKAAGLFDHTRGFKFISYAIWWIRQYILQALAGSSRMVRLPINKLAQNKSIERAHVALEQKLERKASEVELAEVMNLDICEISSGLVSGRHVSLDVPVSDDEEGTMLDMLEDPKAGKFENHSLHAESLKWEIERAFQMLTPRQKEIICDFFGIGTEFPLSLEEISEKFSLSSERIRQIKDKALTRLRNNGNAQVLRSYL